MAKCEGVGEGSSRFFFVFLIKKRLLCIIFLFFLIRNVFSTFVQNNTLDKIFITLYLC